MGSSRICRAHSSAVCCLLVNWESRQFLSAGLMEGLRLWHLEKLRAGEDGLVVKGDGHVTLWDLGLRQVLWSCPAHEGLVEAVSLEPRGSRCLSVKGAAVSSLLFPSMVTLESIVIYRTAGWQFAIDPTSQAVLGTIEHVVNERNTDKVRLLEAVLAMPNTKMDLPIHDDACHFEDYVKKDQVDGFNDIKFYIIDEDVSGALLRRLPGPGAGDDPGSVIVDWGCLWLLSAGLDAYIRVWNLVPSVKPGEPETEARPLLELHELSHTYGVVCCAVEWPGRPHEYFTFPGIGFEEDLPQDDAGAASISAVQSKVDQLHETIEGHAVALEQVRQVLELQLKQQESASKMSLQSEVRSLSECIAAAEEFPMYTVEMDFFLQMTELRAHEQMMSSNLLVEFHEA
eukprot:s94_g16.t1